VGFDQRGAVPVVGLGNGVSGLFLNLGIPGTARGMLCEPGQPMLTLVDEEELARRKNRRAPRRN